MSNDWSNIAFARPDGLDADVSDFSLDPYADGYTYGGKDIWTPERAADNLSRPGINWTFGNNGALDDGVLTFGFWNSLDEVLGSYYGEINEDGFVLTNDSVALYSGYFAAFSELQRDTARQQIQLWDDLIDIEIREADSATDADITFGFTLMSSAAGAHAYLPQEEALNSFGFVDAGRAAGDVWANWLYQDNFAGANAEIGGYGWFSITHELGHSLGLAHSGDYNASDDRDHDGNPDPITYGGDAYFAQDSQQYTIMSYFDGAYTGQNALRWNNSTGGTWMMAQTPAVHDILAVQNIYGADYSTRAGDTVYGFNSTADRDVFDFTINDTPIVTIWDGGGNDTLDVSGFNSDQVIDLNEGAFSSVGYAINAELHAKLSALGWTQADFDGLYESWGLGPDGRPVDNLAIAYGATIENAIGGSGDDLMIGNDANNRLVGNDGDDFLFGGAGRDELIGGSGADTFIFEDTSLDKIRDFQSGVDKIDLSAFEIDADAIKIAGNNLFADTDGNGSYDFHLVVQGSHVQVSDLLFA